MADPRKTINWDGVDGNYATFKIDNSTITYSATAANGSASAGLAVTLSTDDTVALVADGEAVIGRLENVSADNYATVKIKGAVKLPGGTGATLTLGAKIVGCLLIAAKGYIRIAASGTAAEHVLSRGMIVNNDDTSNVVVIL